MKAMYDFIKEVDLTALSWDCYLIVVAIIIARGVPVALKILP